MVSDEHEFGNTHLIDVGDIPTEFDDDITAEKGAGAAERMVEHREEAGGMLIAELKDRFAAFFMDASFLFAVFWMVLLPYRAIAFGNAAGPIPVAGTHGLIFWGIFLLIVFLWFTIFEFAFGASIGKMLCHLTVMKADGTHATLIAAVMRNILRPLDILLMPILVPIAAMEWTAWHRRLGDMAGGTVVIRKLGRPGRQYRSKIHC